MKSDLFKRFSLKTQLIGFLLAFLAILSYQGQSIIPFYKGLLALISGMAMETLVFFIKAKRFKLTESSAITGLIVGFVLSSNLSPWVFIAASVSAIFFKHIIRFQKNPIFNPAALGIFFVIIVTSSFTEWKGAYMWPIIIPLGAYFAFKIKKLEIAVAYLFMSFVFYGGQAFLKGEAVMDSVLYANYFFILIMLTEPKTTPSKKYQKIVFALFVCVAAIGFTLMRIPFDAEIPALLLGNLIYFISVQKKKGEAGK